MYIAILSLCQAFFPFLEEARRDRETLRSGDNFPERESSSFLGSTANEVLMLHRNGN
jgi:hypothetical protein